MSGSTVVGWGPVPVPEVAASAFCWAFTLRHPLIERHKTANRAAPAIIARFIEAPSFENLSAHGHVHLRGRSQIGTNQVQVSKARIAVGLLGIQEIQE